MNTKIVAYTVKEAAKKIGKQPSTVYHLLEEGKLFEYNPDNIVGLADSGKKLISAVSVERYVKKQRGY